tara:strand:+ start:622 stop:930 length:309 start_codon:yes stop_codon:yes gene_type:complete
MANVIKKTVITVPSTQQDLDEINKVLREITDSMIRADSEKEYQAESIKELSKKHNLPVKMLKQVAKMKHLQNSVESFQEQESLEILWDSLNTSVTSTTKQIS